jgi:hypothetical protein
MLKRVSNPGGLHSCNLGVPDLVLGHFVQGVYSPGGHNAVSWKFKEKTDFKNFEVFKCVTVRITSTSENDLKNHKEEVHQATFQFQQLFKVKTDFKNSLTF